VNAFGIGISARVQQSLSTVPGLLEMVEQKCVRGKVANLISRTDLSDQLRKFLTSRYPQCKLCYQEGCHSIDFDQHCFTTTKGQEVKYDLLVAADGVNSFVRKQLVQKKKLKERHYLSRLKWKSLVMPPQTCLEPESFQPLLHKDLVTGRVLAKYPKGHIFLLFWEGDKNPGSIQTSDDLKEMLQEAVQGNFRTKINPLKRLFLSSEQALVVDTNNTLVFNQAAIDEFLAMPPGKSHTVKVDRFHDDSVVLVGDSAHGMYNLLGQGCSCGMKSAQILSDCLVVEDINSDSNAAKDMDFHERLVAYTKRALPEAHAITDLNLIGNLFRSNLLLKLASLPLITIQNVRKKGIFQLIRKPDASYQDIVKSNRLIVWLAKMAWWLDRVPAK